MNVANSRKLLAAFALTITALLPTQMAAAGVILTQSETFRGGGAGVTALGAVGQGVVASADAHGFAADANAASSRIVLGAPVENAARARLAYALPSRRTSIELSATALSGAALVPAASNATTRHTLALSGTNGGAEELDLFLDLQLEGLVLAGSGSSLSLEGFFNAFFRPGPGPVGAGIDSFGLSIACDVTQCVGGPQQRTVYLGRLPPSSTRVLNLAWVASASVSVTGNAVGQDVASAAALVRLDRALLTLRGVEVAGPPNAVSAPRGAASFLAAGLALLAARRRRRHS